MTLLDLTPDELLTTTRAVRKRLDFDRPVELDTIKDCVQIAAQGPSGSNAQGWHFVVITDDAKRKAIGDVYKKAYAGYAAMGGSAHSLIEKQTNEGDKAQMTRVAASADYLGENMGRAPALIIPCLGMRLPALDAKIASSVYAGVFGSILPGFWSFMLAARARGLGTAWTTLHLNYEKDAAEILGIDYDNVTQCALSPIAYTKGTDFKPARRKPMDDFLHINGW
jgi:nitroreductase